MKLDAAACKNLDRTIALDWLATNGLGGYASGSVCGANTRKYHGYLVVAARPPVDRYVVLSRVEERVQIGSQLHDLSTNEFPDVIHPQGFLALESFEMKAGPVWRYRINGALIEKSITLVHGQDTVIVRYELLEAPSPQALDPKPGAPKQVPAVKLLINPMLAGRDFHSTIQAHQRPSWNVGQAANQSLILAAPECPIRLVLTHNAEKVQLGAGWWYNFTFRQERMRGYPDRDDLWTPGRLDFTLELGRPVGIICSTTEVPWSQHGELMAREENRRLALRKPFAQEGPLGETLETLAAAADQFLVRRGAAGSAGNNQMSVIAGYPWFEDWGRDTFIALPGLTLVTGRYKAAASILATFADHLHQGLLPNRFPDKALKPDYNTVDASLWFVQSAYQYWRYTGDLELLKYLFKPLNQIMERYRDGTLFGIRMDHDGLIRAGEPHSQLTWMDAKVGQWVVTPRHGKPVEINALWYNALRVMSLLSRIIGETQRGGHYASLAEMTAASFATKFWNPRNGYLNDVIDDEGNPDTALRPNQILAVSLPFSAIVPEIQKKVVSSVQQALLTPLGLRTLAPGSMGYHGNCVGDQLARDMAYHQGTTWPWLIGPFVSAYVRAHGQSQQSRSEAAGFLAPFHDHMQAYGLGSICEIADGNAPHTPRGCVAQAWSVAEVFRAYWEDVLAQAPKWPHERSDAELKGAAAAGAKVTSC